MVRLGYSLRDIEGMSFVHWCHECCVLRAVYALTMK
jgi:hypothetical protein